ncbi:MAG: DEAD/DEAH box helicase [Candidatus Hydrogenedentes bacterium]|nr:DEAD/DEAH box helicase [Candidatus Hydrogenedentota bacterium]MBI3117983.1 DEAD/DEAH box helicase [Candidatus Hydrogenedentota bacterium]
MSFETLPIDPRCLHALKKLGITQPTPVQARAIPLALEGRDVTAIAQTGTGKTLAFGLPALTRLAATKGGASRMLVLTPTRELAQQVHGVLENFGRALGLNAVCIYGGAGIERQAQLLRRGCAIIVATPGRLLDHLERGTVRLDKIEVLVLDEADRMLDMGFMPDIKRIMAKIPKERQTLMFSATLPGEIGDLAATLQRNPAKIVIGAVATPAAAVRQGVYTVEQNGKLMLLSQILRQPQVGPALVFLRTKHRTDRIAKALHQEGFKVQAIHGGRSQRQRDQAIDGFRQGRYTVLVATDVAARGLDVQGITHVVNFDIPKTSDDYIHRIGRTARASASGDAITFVSPEEHRELSSIEKALGKRLPREEWEGAVAVQTRGESNAPKRPFRKDQKPGSRQRRSFSRSRKAAAARN